MNVLISSYHMNLVLKKFQNILKKKNIKIDKIIRNPSVKENELLKVIHKYDGVICSDDEFTKKVLAKADRLKVISKWGTGIDSIDSNYAKKKGIKIFNTPGAFTSGVAQYAIGMIFNLSRKISKIDQSVKMGNWKKFQGINIEGKKIGIIGLGKIGSQIIKYIKGFNVVICGNDKKETVNKMFKKKGVKILSLNKIFSYCDIIIISVDLNKSSHHLVGAKQLMKLNENKILINISRGSVVDNTSLIKAINKKKFQVGFDVFEEEPINKKVLKKLKSNNSILSSHNAFNTKEEVDFVHVNTINNLLKGLKN
jgi:D-3-phosphoglycerate dehydrogenase / 2-oxoglutarate reductase